jgi:hypothetical protein
MTKKQLDLIKSVYDGLAQGVSNTININTAYGYLPGKMEGAPMRAKIREITRFMMLSYSDAVNALKVAETKSKEKELLDSVGTIENKHKQSHKESTNDDMADEIAKNRMFLTKEEKEDLKGSKAGTKLVIETPDGKKSQTKTK